MDVATLGWPHTAGAESAGWMPLRFDVFFFYVCVDFFGLVWLVLSLCCTLVRTCLDSLFLLVGLYFALCELLLYEPT